jgi:hypothetical protein
VLSAEKANCVVFAAKRRPVTLQSLAGGESGDLLDAALRSQLRGEFAHIGWNACPLAA